MRWVLRGVLSGLLVATVLAQVARSTDVDAPAEDYAVLVYQLVTLAQWADVSHEAGVLRATASGCRNPVMITYVNADGRGSEAARALLGADVVVRYVYLGAVVDKLASIAVAGRWATASALAALGLRRAGVPRNAIVVALPRECPQLAELDWSALSP